MNCHPIDFEPRGFYEPGIFHLRVNNCADLSELNRLKEDGFSADWVPTFLHEYVHFLQDITTTHGLLNLIFFIEELKQANKMIMGGADEFQVPLRWGNDFNYLTNRKLFEIYYGCRDESKDAKQIKYGSYTQNNEVVTTANGEDFHVPKYSITYFDEGAQTGMTHHFGSRHIKEYMSHAIQSDFAPASAADHDDIPYRLVELIIQKEVPRLANSPSLLVALCDASLMDMHPARLFFDSIERMKAAPDWQPTDVESIYQFVFNGHQPMFNGAVGFLPVFEGQINLARSAFGDSLKADVFRNNVEWFNDIISKAQKLRCYERGFVTKLVSDEGRLAKRFFEIVGQLGVPFTTNKESKGCFVPPINLDGLKIVPYYPKVFQAIRKTLLGSQECSLQPICEANTPKITTADCSSKPWARVNLPELCPYAQIWKSWGFACKTPQITRL